MESDVLLYRWTLHQSQVKRTSIDLNVLKFCELRFSFEVIYHLSFSKHIHFNSKQTTVWRHLLVCLSGCERPIASLSFSSMQVSVRCFCLHWNVKSKFNSINWSFHFFFVSLIFFWIANDYKSRWILLVGNFRKPHLVTYLISKFKKKYCMHIFFTRFVAIQHSAIINMSGLSHFWVFFLTFSRILKLKTWLLWSVFI